MAILWDDGFYTELDDNRILVITGRLSSGKSLLACELAERYLKKKYRLLSQTQCVWNDDFETVIPDDKGKLHTVIWMDEGGLQYRTSKASQALSSFAAKMDCYIIFSGKKMPHEDLCTLSCSVWFDFFKWFLIPIKIWRYDVTNNRKSYSGYFVQTSWWEYYGIYNTLDPGDAADDIHNFIKDKTQEYFARYKRKYKLYDVESEGGEDGLQEPANELALSVRNLDKAASTIHKRKTIGRR